MVSYRWQDGRHPPGGKGDIKPNDWNVYAIEWTPEKITWTVNGKATHSYEKVGDDPKRFPWTEPFYLMIDIQLGGQWVGAIDESTLPTAMHVDWVKIYSGSRNGKTFTEFLKPAKKPTK
jgi:beta-glucanase (GH16 family)